MADIFNTYSVNMKCKGCDRFQTEMVSLPVGKRILFGCKECHNIIAEWSISLPATWFDIEILKTDKGRVNLV